MFLKAAKKQYRVMFIILISLIAIVGAVFGYMNHPKFGRAARGERKERIANSPNYRDGTFHNQYPTPQITSDKSRLSLMYDFLFQKRENNRPKQAIPAIKSDLRALDKEAELLVWFGHSSYLVQSDGKRMLIDPVFEQASPVPLTNRPFEGTDIYKAADMPDIDYLIITHDHWDHLDYQSVTELRDRISMVICPLGVGEYFEQWGFAKDKICEMDWNEQAQFEDGYVVDCLPSRHFSGRTFKSNQTLWASFMIRNSTSNIYISGDGGYDRHFAQIAERFPKIDLAIMENGQYDKDWRHIHLLPEDLKQAIADLKPSTVMAGHNSKFALAKHAWDEPLNTAAEIADQNPDIKVLTPQIGEVINLGDSTVKTNKWWSQI